VAAQVVYYFKGYFAATRDDARLVDFAVPSGNFGNILAAHVAREMGLPVRRLILATNENDVLDEFFRTGRYRPRSAGEVHATSSPSMDISKASNFERFIFDVTGRSAPSVRELWSKLAEEGGFDLAETRWWPKVQAAGIVSGRSTHADRLATFAKRDALRTGHDPHTADGVEGGTEYHDRRRRHLWKRRWPPSLRRRSGKPSAAIPRVPPLARSRGAAAAQHNASR
jgi:threonine synthase